MGKHKKDRDRSENCSKRDDGENNEKDEDSPDSSDTTRDTMIDKLKK